MSKQLVTPGTPAREALALERLIAQENLEGYHAAFLLTCKAGGLSPATIHSYRKLIAHFIRYVYALGITYPQQLTSSHIRLFILSKQETCNSVSIHTYYRHIKCFCNWMVEEKILDQSPMATIKPPRVIRTLIKPFSLDQVKVLLSLCNESTFLGLRNKTIMLVFVETAIRLSEMIRMQIADIDFDRGLVKVHGKGAKERVVAIQTKTKEMLLRYLLSRDDPYRCVWVTEERRPLTIRGIQTMIRYLGQDAKLRDVRCSPHTFRHTSATMMLDSGAGVFQVQAILGHSTLDMTRRYVATLNSEKAAEAHKNFSPVEHFKLE